MLVVGVTFQKSCGSGGIALPCPTTDPNSKGQRGTIDHHHLNPEHTRPYLENR